MRNQRPLGSSEKEVLKNLYLNGSVWTDGGPVLWENKYWTLQLLASLTVKGYVTEVRPNERYEMASPGLQQIMEWGIVIRPTTPARTRQPVHFPEQGGLRRPSTLRRY